MDSDFLPSLTPVQARESVLAQEAELRALANELRPANFEARCLVQNAADRLMEAARTMAAEIPGRPPARPGASALPPRLRLAQ